MSKGKHLRPPREHGEADGYRESAARILRRAVLDAQGKDLTHVQDKAQAQDDARAWLADEASRGARGRNHPTR